MPSLWACCKANTEVPNALADDKAAMDENARTDATNSRDDDMTDATNSSREKDSLRVRH